MINFFLLCLLISCIVEDKPSLESIDDDRYFLIARPNLSRVVGLNTFFLNNFLAALGALALFRITCKPAKVCPKGPDVMIMSPTFAPCLGTIFFALPIRETLITSSFPSLTSPPTILTPNSFVA